MKEIEKTKYLKKTTIIIATITTFSGAYILSVANVALPAIGKQFGMTSIMMGWVTTSVLLVTSVFMVPMGRLGDIYGRKKIFICGLIMKSCGALFCGLANSGMFIIITRIIQGVGTAMYLGAILAILISVFPSEERGKAIGISVGTSYAGFTVAPFLGGFLTEHLGWRSIFFLGFLMTAVALVITFIFLKGDWRDAEGEKFDLAGSVVFISFLALLVYGFTTLPKPSGFLMLFLGIIGLVFFWWFESMTESPVLNVRILGRNKVFVFSNIATMINYSGNYAISFLISLYLQYILGHSPQEAGLVLLLNPVGMGVLSMIAGTLSDRFQPQIIASMGMAMSTVLLLLLSFLNDTSGLSYISVLMFLTGAATGIFNSPNSNAVMSSVEKRFLGVASGTQGTVRGVGMVLSMGVTMILFTLLMGGTRITPEYYPDFITSMKISFVIFAALNFMGIFCQLAGRKK